MPEPLSLVNEEFNALSTQGGQHVLLALQIVKKVF
jgi:hypothetical protein